MIESYGKLTVLRFGFIKGSSPLIIGLDVLQYPKIENNEHRLSFKRPTDKSKRVFYT